MPNVFISYRRSDTTAGYASWLYSELRNELGQDAVFMDVDSIPFGDDFVEHLRSRLENCDVALVLIGPNWLGATDADGNRRLESREDFVHIEVASVLRLPGVKVIPVLVDGAAMPRSTELPDELVPLARRQCLVFDRSGGSSIQRLLAAIQEVEPRPAPKAASTAGHSRRPKLYLLAGLGLVAAGVIVALVVTLTGGGSSPSTSGTTNGSDLTTPGRLELFSCTSEGTAVTFRYPARLHPTTLQPDPGKPPTFQFANGDELITVRGYSTIELSRAGVNEARPSQVVAWLMSKASRGTGYRQLAPPTKIDIPSAFNSNSAVEWTYADTQGKHAVYAAFSGSEGWVVSAQAPSLQTATADGSTVFDSMTLN
ncbi:MAG TPA: toll/interleukin-1 receptor domain-containing protein [Gaiellaceae bacterium]|nr:toll/interleukin-1 receptor domain-containing protein [Gaiellaceae bacterium]